MKGRPDRVLPLFALGAVAIANVAPGLRGVLTELTVVAIIVLSYDVVLRRMGAPVLLQPGAVALAAWLSGVLLARNISPLLVLLAAALAGGAVGAAAVMSPLRLGAAGWVLTGLALSVGLSRVVPVVSGFTAPVFLGIDLGTPTAVLIAALLALAAGAWLSRTLLAEDLGRWLAVVRADPALAARSGLSPRALIVAGLALAGALAGMAGWAAALATMGAPVSRAVDPALALAWLVAPLSMSSGRAGGLVGTLPADWRGGAAATLGGAAVFVGLARAAAALGLSTVALAAPAAAGLLWWQNQARLRGAA